MMTSNNWFDKHSQFCWLILVWYQAIFGNSIDLFRWFCLNFYIEGVYKPAVLVLISITLIHLTLNQIGIRYIYIYTDTFIIKLYRCHLMINWIKDTNSKMGKFLLRIFGGKSICICNKNNHYYVSFLYQCCLWCQYRFTNWHQSSW